MRLLSIFFEKQAYFYKTILEIILHHVSKLDIIRTVESSKNVLLKSVWEVESCFR